MIIAVMVSGDSVRLLMESLVQAMDILRMVNYPYKLKILMALAILRTGAMTLQEI